MSGRHQQVDKLRKLLALAGSPNEHESKVARRAADRLMLRYGLTEADVREADDAGYCEMSLGITGWNVTWRFTLVSLAARVCGVEAVALRRGAKRLVKLCGARRDVGMANELYQKLENVVGELESRVAADGPVELLSLMVGDVSARTISDSFRRGAVAGLARLFYVAKQRERSEARDSTPAGAAVPVVEKPEDGCRALVRVRSLVGARATTHTDRVREKYSPETRPIDIVGDSVPLLFDLGYRFAVGQVVVGSDGNVQIKQRRGR